MADEALLAGTLLVASVADWKNGAFAAAAATVTLLARRRGGAENGAQVLAAPVWLAWYSLREFHRPAEPHPFGHAFASLVLAGFSGAYLLLRLRDRDLDTQLAAERVAAWMVFTSSLLSCSFQGAFEPMECALRSAMFLAVMAGVARTLRGGRCDAGDVPLALAVLLCETYLAFAYAGALGAACVLLGGKSDGSTPPEQAKDFAQAPVQSAGRVYTRFARTPTADMA